jgi:multimeric flavodoxin WrbA
MTRTKKLLGISAGHPSGSAEILLKRALASAQAAGAEVSMIRLADLSLPAGLGDPDSGDAWWVYEELLEADGLIFSTPIVTRTMDARLKVLVDHLLGPNADAAIIKDALDRRAAGVVEELPFRVDERVLKPRVAGFLAVGGSLTPQWKSLTLPLMHTLTLSMSIGVVDQVTFAGAGTPQSVVLDPSALSRADVLGERVAGQLGRGLDDVHYQGEPGLCPMCHLNVVELHGTDVICATCGSQGTLGAEGQIEWRNLDTSVISFAERQDHSEEIMTTAAAHAPRREEISRLAAEELSFEVDVLRP